MKLWKSIVLMPYQAKLEIRYHYTDLTGMVTVDRNPTPESTKNGLMHLGLTMCFYSVLNMLDVLDTQEFSDTVKACQQSPGNYDRYPAYADKPRNDDPNAQDDYTGVVAGSKVTNSQFHKDVLIHGINNVFIYNNQRPGLLISDVNPFKWQWWAFRLRFIDHISWYYLCNQRLRILSPILMGWIALKTIRSKIGSDRLLDYMFVESLAKDKWEWQKFRKWFLPRSKLVESTKGYFHAEHPLIDLAEAVIFNEQINKNV